MGLSVEPKSHFTVEDDVCDNIPQVIQLMFEQHATYNEWTPELHARFVEQYIKALDPTKTRLLMSDVKEIRVVLQETISKVAAGQCTDITVINDRVLERAEEDLEFARGFLGQDYHLNQGATKLTDVEQRVYPENSAAKESLMANIIHFQVAEYMVDGATIDNAKKKVIESYERSATHFAGRSFLELADTLMDSVGASLDPHTTYFTPAELGEFNIMLTHSFEGVGVDIVVRNGAFYVGSVLPGGGAARGGKLRVGDKIMRVTQEDGKMVSVAGLSLDDVVALLRGPKGTSVTLTVSKEGPDGTKKHVITIVRDKIKVDNEKATLKIDTVRPDGAKGLQTPYKVGIIDLKGFYMEDLREEDAGSSARDVKELLRKAKEQNLDGLVIDLSQNPGGFLDAAVEIAGYFIQKGAIVKMGVSAQQGLERVSDEDLHVEFAGPVVILVSRMSASASEILAGALKAYSRAVVVGDTNTFGKGTTQTLTGEGMRGQGAVKVTVGFFYIPDGRSTQHDGVKSDVVIPSMTDRDGNDERDLEYSLVPAQVEPFVSFGANPLFGASRYQPVTDQQIEVLKRRSAERVSRDKGFKEIKRLQDRADRGGVVKAADLIKGAHETEDKTKGLVIDPTLQLQEAKKILADLIQLQRAGAARPVVVGGKGKGSGLDIGQ
ncbi:MAG: PDZ domain-containing protein [Deltaproteobacteria bacterium]|nr:PDZ domain-containing protein [Deltaproteobacteria bacterium]